MASTPVVPWKPALRALGRAGLDTGAIAEASGVSWRTIHRLLRGETDPIKPVALCLVYAARQRGLIAA